MLSSRERILRFFAGRDVDRRPIWLLFPHHPFSSYVDVWNIPCYAPIMRRIEAGDADTFDRRGCAKNPLYTACPDLHFETVRQGRDTLRTLSYKDFSLTAYTKYEGGTRVKFFVDDPAQWKRLLSIPYEPIRPDLAAYRREREETGDKGVFMLDLGDPLAALYGMMSAQDFAMATATDLPILEEVLAEMHRRVMDLYRTFLENDAADAYFIVGAEFAGPPLVSPAMFRRLSVGFVRDICDLVRSFGKLSIVHYHGNLFTILDGMRDIGMDGLHTVEAPPIGDCTLAQARDALPGVALIGPIQYDDIIRLPPDAIKAQVEDAYRQMRGAPFILSPTAGPYEPFIDARAVGNYNVLLDTALRYAGNG